jgi:hypothetical protein
MLTELKREVGRLWCRPPDRNRQDSHAEDHRPWLRRPPRTAA